MAAPASQQDIMGGMGAPTQYANGVMGYSSQPLYQQSLDQFAAARPAQKSYMDSFFIDPDDGKYAYQPFDYTRMSSVDDAVAKALAERDAADEAYRMSQFSPGFDMDGMGGQPSTPSSGGGYTSFGDMFDGGGPGYSGDAHGSGGGEDADEDGDGHISIEEAKDLDQNSISKTSNAVQGIDPRWRRRRRRRRHCYMHCPTRPWYSSR